MLPQDAAAGAQTPARPVQGGGGTMLLVVREGLDSDHGEPGCSCQIAVEDERQVGDALKPLLLLLVPLLGDLLIDPPELVAEVLRRAFAATPWR